MSIDWVYQTAGGGRWHQREDCEALAKGQQEATDRGRTTHPIRRVPPGEANERIACGWCVHNVATPTAVLTDPALKQLRTDTEYERLFLDHVLGSLPELWDWTIESQKTVTVAARTYRLDFAVTSGADRIAIEIDGENKGPNAPTHDDWTRRQTALVSDGWEVLRFTNRQVRDEQEACRRELAVSVARLRERGRHSAASLPPPVAPAVQATPTAAAGRTRRSWLWAVAVVIVAVLVVGGWVAVNNNNGLDPHFDSCSEAITAGFGAYQQGVDEEYAWYEDRDKDGVVCES